LVEDVAAISLLLVDGCLWSCICFYRDWKFRFVWQN